MINVTVFYPLDKFKWGSLDAELEKLAIQHGSKGENGAGTGFGERDIDWDFSNTKQVKAFVAAVRKRFGKDLRISTTSEDI